VSGGQTGVDRAALDAAREAGLLRGGWCPRGRLAEDGPLPAEYPLRETPEADPAQRTAWNVRDSDGTLILLRGAPRGGTALTLTRAAALGRPVLALDLGTEPDPVAVRVWLGRHRIRTLHVAGPRESEAPGIHAASLAFLRRVLAPLRSDPSRPAG